MSEPRSSGDVAAMRVARTRGYDGAEHAHRPTDQFMTSAAKSGDDVHGCPPARRFVEPTTGVTGILERLEREDAIAVPALTTEYRAWLLEEAHAAPFRRARAVVGHGERLVRQRMGVHDGFGRNSRFRDLARRYQAVWDSWLAGVSDCPFESRLVFNDLMLQVYEPGEIGITPHLDRTSYRNLICLFVLEGRGRFGICEDRSGRGARIIDHEPGDVVLTRAPGFRRSDYRPFHFLDRITERRYVFGLRHDRAGAPALWRSRAASTLTVEPSVRKWFPA